MDGHHSSKVICVRSIRTGGTNASLAQWTEHLATNQGCRESESLMGYQSVAGRAAMQLPLKKDHLGSTPRLPTTCMCNSIGRDRPFKPTDIGSSPITCTIENQLDRVQAPLLRDAPERVCFDYKVLGHLEDSAMVRNRLESGHGVTAQTVRF
jgi:hypothetical protein